MNMIKNNQITQEPFTAHVVGGFRSDVPAIMVGRGDVGRDILRISYEPVGVTVNKKMLLYTFCSLYMGDVLHNTLLRYLLQEGHIVESDMICEFPDEMMLCEYLYTCLFQKPDEKIINLFIGFFKNTLPYDIASSVDAFELYDQLNLCQICDESYFHLTKKLGIQGYDLLQEGLYDNLDINTHYQCGQSIILALLLILIQKPDMPIMIVNKAFVRIITYIFFVCQNMTSLDEPIIEVDGYDNARINRMAVRMAATAFNPEDGVARLIDASAFGADTFEEVYVAVEERFQKNGKLTKEMQVVYEQIKQRVPDIYDTLKKSEYELERLRREYIESLKSIIGKAMNRESESDAIIQELNAKILDIGGQKIQDEINALQKELSDSRKTSAKYREQNQRYSEMIDTMREEKKDAEDKLEQANAKIAELMAELERRNSVSDDVQKEVGGKDSYTLSAEDVAFLNTKRVAVIGGHERFHRSLLKAVPNWICVDTERETDYKPICKNAELVVIMANHISHSAYSKAKSYCIDVRSKEQKIPYLSLNNNNANRCLSSILEYFSVNSVR